VKINEKIPNPLCLSSLKCQSRDVQSFTKKHNWENPGMELRLPLFRPKLVGRLPENENRKIVLTSIPRSPFFINIFWLTV
jgi:hypothetical protein